jgi:hypothetical protein
MEQVRDFMQDWGIWTIALLYLAKLITGVLVAIVNNEFKAFYLDESLRKDAVKIIVFVLLTGVAKVPDLLPVFGTEEMRAGLGVLLTTSLAAGVIKNLVHLSPELGGMVPSSLREPERLRLGNPKNTE